MRASVEVTGRDAEAAAGDDENGEQVPPAARADGADRQGEEEQVPVVGGRIGAALGGKLL